MKKFTLLIFLVLGFLLQTSAQNRIVEKSFVVNSDDKIRLDLKFGETIQVKSWDKNEVSFKADIEINQGKLNDALILDFIQDNDRLKITSDYDEEMLEKGRREDCPDSSYTQFSWNDGSVICSNITYTVYIPENGNLDVESISSDIELIDLSGPIRAKSISGFVDLSWPSGKPANIDIKTVSGEAFTNLDALQFENKKGHIPTVGYKLKGQIGSGGPHVSLESVSGNIYLRRFGS